MPLIRFFVVVVFLFCIKKLTHSALYCKIVSYFFFKTSFYAEQQVLICVSDLLLTWAEWQSRFIMLLFKCTRVRYLLDITGTGKAVTPLIRMMAQGFRQCCGSGSTCFWANRIRIHQSEVWIRILLLSCKNSKKNLDSYYFVTLFDFLSLKNDVNVASKSNKQKKLC